LYLCGQRSLENIQLFKFLDGSQKKYDKLEAAALSVNFIFDKVQLMEPLGLISRQVTIVSCSPVSGWKSA
jgi:hypothetical protein